MKRDFSNIWIPSKDCMPFFRLKVILLLSMVLSSCVGFNFGRDHQDIAGGNSSTVNGKLLNGDGTPPIPQQRAGSSLVRAAELENQRIIATYGGVYSNRNVETQLSDIVSKLVASSDEPSQRFQIVILNSPAVNAFALPGGFLYITRGLLALANDASEVAAVLAHEMAHVTSRHGQERLRQARKTELVSRAVQGVISDKSTVAALKQKRQLDFATFTQSQELDADLIGVQNAGRAGYDPFAAARFLDVMANYQNYRTAATVARRNDGPDFLSTHPSTPRRIQQARLSARRFGAPGIGITDREKYQKAIDGMIFGDDPEEGYVRDRTFYHPQLRFTFSVPRGYVIENASDAVLATAQNGDAVRFDAVNVPKVLSLSDYLQSGWLNGLDRQSITNFSVNGAPAASATAQVAEWSFKITVIRSKTSTYRMIFATKNPSTLFDRAASTTVSSFRSLTAREARGLSPLRIRVVRVRNGDNSFTLSRGMRGLVANPDQAFKAFNGLGRNEQPKPGSLVKVVVDGVSG